MTAIDKLIQAMAPFADQGEPTAVAITLLASAHLQSVRSGLSGTSTLERTTHDV